MVRKVTLSVVVGALMLIGGGAQAAGGATGQPSKQPEQKSKLVTEGEFSKWLINVLGLARTLPVSPTEQQCFAALLQNSISPKAGWNSTNLVTMGTLARVVAQSLHKQGEVQNPQDDAAWIQYLKTIGIEFGTIGQAMAALGPLDPAFSGDATVISTDPLKKQARLRPLDEQQFGTDLQPIPPFLDQVVVEQPVTQAVIQQVFQQAPQIPVRPRPVTPS